MFFQRIVLLQNYAITVNTYPALGSTIGVIDNNIEPAVKPRVALESYAMNEKYDADKVANGAIEYDAELRKWWDSIGLTEMPSYTAQTAQFYSNIYFPEVAKSLVSQGFRFTDED